MPLISQPYVREIDEFGQPQAGAVAYFYESGTTTPLLVYADADLLAYLPVPVVADAYGIFPDMYTDPAYTYRMVIKTAGGTLLHDIDPISGGAAIGTDDLLDGSVTTPKLANLSVTAEKLASQSVSNYSFVDAPVNTVKGSVTGPVIDLNNKLLIGILDLVGTYVATAVPVVADTDLALICNGRSLLRTTYPRLFAKIGTTYGAADATHFTIPDLRGYGLVGADFGRGLQDPLNVGQSHLDQFQGHRISLPSNEQDNPGNNYVADSDGSGTSKTAYGTIITDGVNGTPRTGLTTHGRQAACMFMIYY